MQVNSSGFHTVTLGTQCIIMCKDNTVRVMYSCTSRKNLQNFSWINTVSMGGIANLEIPEKRDVNGITKQEIFPICNKKLPVFFFFFKIFELKKCYKL